MTMPSTRPTPEFLVELLSKSRFPLTFERGTQKAIADELEAAGVDFEREARLAPSDIVDFMVGGIAIEVKIGGGRRRNILRQCERYCAHDAVVSLILATNTMMGFPPEINGKPCYLINLGKAWL